MKYETKIELNGTTIGSDVSQGEPYISNVVLRLSTGMDQGSIAIGGIASDCLSFIINNSPKSSYDGDEIKFYIAEPIEEEKTEASDIEIENEGVAAEDAYSDEDEGEEEDEEEEEDLTEEEAAEADSQAEESIGSQYDFFVEAEEELDEEDDPDVPEVIGDDDIEDATNDEPVLDWVCKGTYYVTDCSSTDGYKTVSITAMDILSQMNDMYRPTTSSCSVQEMYNDLAAQIAETFAIKVEPYEFDQDLYNYNIEIPAGYVSCRNAYGWFAGLAGGYVQVDDDNMLGIDFYEAAETPLLISDISKIKQTSSGMITVSGLTCDAECSIFPSGTQLIEVGNGETISFENPFMTESVLNNILEKIKGLTYEGATVSARWHSEMEVGMLVRVMSADEYANYIQLINSIKEAVNDEEALILKQSVISIGTVVITTNQKIDFSGSDTTSLITSTLTTKTTRNNLVPSTAKNIMAKVVMAESVLTGRMEASEAIVGKISGNLADFKTITAESLAALSGQIGELTASQITTEYLQANYAAIDLANIEDGCITTAMIGKGVVDTAQIADGSITDAKIVGLTANKITAGKLDAGTIEVVNLNAANITVGTINGKQIAPGAIDMGNLSDALGTTITTTENTAKDALETAEDVKDKAVYHIEEQYALSESELVAPTSGWSTIPPDWESDKYMWKKTITIYGNGTEVKTDPVCLSGADGEDATLLRIDSSRGTVFKNNQVNTVLSVVIYKGGKRITDIAALKQEYGATAYLEWQWQRMNDTGFGVISAADSRIGNSGFTFTLSPQDVDTKVVFMCSLIID